MNKKHILIPALVVALGFTTELSPSCNQRCWNIIKLIFCCKKQLAPPIVQEEVHSSQPLAQGDNDTKTNIHLPQQPLPPHTASKAARLLLAKPQAPIAEDNSSQNQSKQLSTEEIVVALAQRKTPGTIRSRPRTLTHTQHHLKPMT